MRYNYPYKEWLAGFLFFLLIVFYGVYLLYYMRLKWIYCIGYIAICYLFVDWYWNKIQLYKSKSFKIEDNKIEFLFPYKEVKSYDSDDIEYIFNSNHKQRLKTHNVVHFFMKNGDYYYLTNEINNYEYMKKQLYKSFPTKYYTIEDLFYGVLDGNIKMQFIDKLKDIS